MLIIFTDNQILSPRQVCQNCLLATRHGLPRWYQGKLGCGRNEEVPRDAPINAHQCYMGFQVADIAEEGVLVE